MGIGLFLEHVSISGGSRYGSAAHADGGTSRGSGLQ